MWAARLVKSAWRRLVVMAACIIVGVAVGCENNMGAIGCPRADALTVLVEDSVTGIFLTSGVQLVARSESESDTVVVDQTSGGRPTLGRDPGTDSLTVTKTGYATWAQSGIVVTSDACGGPATVHLVVKLQPD